MSRRSSQYLPTGTAFRQQLQAAVDQLIAEFDPDSIYLFGSLTAGRARPESSVDILIISEGVGSQRFLQRIKRAIKVTEDSLPNIAPLVYTPDEVELLQQQGDGFIQEVLEEGKVLYQSSDKQSPKAKAKK